MVVLPGATLGVIVSRGVPPVVFRSQVNNPASPELLAVRVEQTTKALVMSMPLSVTWVGVALFGRLAVPLVTVLTMAPSLTAGTTQARAARIAIRAVSQSRRAPACARLPAMAPMPGRLLRTGRAKASRHHAFLTTTRIVARISPDQAGVWACPGPIVTRPAGALP